MRFDITENELREVWENPIDVYFTIPSKVEINTDGTSYFKVTVSAMYDAPTLNLQIFRRLADLFGTENINDDDRFNFGGCETCDYGSCYGYTLTIRP